MISGTYSTLLIVPAVAVGWDRWNARRRPAAAAVAPTIDAPRVDARKRRAS